MNQQQIECRTFSARELRATQGDAGPRIDGYAAVFNQWSENLGVFMEIREEVAPGAFAETLKTADVRALFNHDPNYVLGRNKAGTLALREDSVGLWFDLTPPDTQFARDLMVSIKRGDINQMSFQFEVIDDAFRYNRETDIVYRTLRKVVLHDVSPVTFPAYPQTSVNVRAGGADEALLQRADAFRKQHIGQAADSNDERELERQAARELMRMRVRIAEQEI